MSGQKFNEPERRAYGHGFLLASAGWLAMVFGVAWTMAGDVMDKPAPPWLAAVIVLGAAAMVGGELRMNGVIKRAAARWTRGWP